MGRKYNYIIFESRNWYIILEITMTRKSGKFLHVTYGALNRSFDLWSQLQCTPWSPPLEIEPTTTVCRSGRAIYHNLLIQHRLYVAWNRGSVVEFRLLLGQGKVVIIYILFICFCILFWMLLFQYYWLYNNFVLDSKLHRSERKRKSLLSSQIGLRSKPLSYLHSIYRFETDNQ